MSERPWEEKAPPAKADAPAATGPTGRDLSLVLAAAGAAALLTAGVLMSRGAAAPAAAPASAGSAPVAARASSGSKVAALTRWTTVTRARWVGDDRRDVAFELPAQNRVPVWMKLVQPSLIVRCIANRPEVFVFTDTAAAIEPESDHRAVRVSFDDESPVAERWMDSMDHNGLFAPDGAGYLDRLLRARMLRFEFTPHNAAPVEVHFDVTGLSDLVGPVAKKCGRT